MTISTNWLPPTRADIASEFGFKSANAAEEHLKALAKKRSDRNYTWRIERIRLTVDTQRTLVGRVAAGSPILAQEHVDDYCDISQIFSA